jgi:hemolysin III
VTVELARSETAGVGADEASIDLHTLERPTWRGRIHTYAFGLSIPAGFALIVAADGVEATTAAAIYAGTLVTTLGTSAAYHRLARSARARAVMQRMDHSMIFLLIAGTYVPFCLVALPRTWGIPILVIVGALAALGIVIKLVAFGSFAPWFQYALYPLLGWVAVVTIPVLVNNMSPGQLALVVSGGLVYTVGSVIFMLKKPDPWPGIFGYHEVWHGFTIVAAALHFAAVASLVS